MNTCLWLLLCSIILPRGATPFITSSSVATRGADDGRSILSPPIRQTQLFVSSTTSTPNVWVPPSQRLLETRSTIFKIQQPEELLDFISEDDRLCVIKVYASWCQACKKFDLRYRKLASKYSDKYTTNTKGAPPAEIKQQGKIRFAELQYDNPQNEDLCDSVLGTTSFPYILIYKRQEGKIRGFHCTPAKFQLLVNTVEELLIEDEESCGEDNSFQKQVIDLGLADRR
eukprot:CAMPEP_0113422602 /NCGR_PEP_ID=MMETSP0013_2-20120614/28548_1 /TAXON_ID=2843 ORGANISM="Skeletonema costatum, Strain 1716" /NCGR_SAMPLE_ID=MMETSP0013_2 /ASSEMBLY_ACC=CAM_ASM_000158 /LENGTH=227 /DNA_ID=CAMNT_0000310357 /DNA_START=36 /DNA_END=719 /DNA_ORIENTATION=- /assembly_acc=CAM_ASM_000158